MQTKAIENLVDAVNVADNSKQFKPLDFLYSLLTSNTFLKIQNFALYFKIIYWVLNLVSRNTELNHHTN